MPRMLQVYWYVCVYAPTADLQQQPAAHHSMTKPIHPVLLLHVVDKSVNGISVLSIRCAKHLNALAQHIFISQSL